MRVLCAFEFAAIEMIRRVERDADAFLRMEQRGNFLPRLAPLALFADEIEVRFQDTVICLAAALIFFIHHCAG